MCDMIENHPQQAREYLNKLQSVKWDNYLTQQEATMIVSEMIPKPAWTHTAWEGAMRNLGHSLSEEPYYNENALYATMSMISSDSGETIISMMNNPDTNTYFKFVYKLALDKLKDKDGNFNIRSYFRL